MGNEIEKLVKEMERLAIRYSKIFDYIMITLAIISISLSVALFLSPQTNLTCGDIDAEIFPLIFSIPIIVSYTLFGRCDKWKRIGFATLSPLMIAFVFFPILYLLYHDWGLLYGAIPLLIFELFVVICPVVTDAGLIGMVIPVITVLYIVYGYGEDTLSGSATLILSITYPLLALILYTPFSIKVSDLENKNK